MSQPAAAQPPKPQRKKREPAKKKKKQASTSYLEKMVATTEKFKVEDLLDLYRVYDQTIIDLVYQRLLFPYSRFARQWLLDQGRDVLAGTDRNRLILTSRSRKASEAAQEAMNQPARDLYTKCLKPKHQDFVPLLLRHLHSFATQGTVPSGQELRDLGVSRLVYDDIGLYVTTLTNRYPMLVADWVSARAQGDETTMLRVEQELRAQEVEVGVRRQDAWYMVVNTHASFDHVQRIVQRITLAYSRLLYRFAHALRGITTTEENFSSGYEGMIRAARNYDPADGSSFIAHCQWWVRSSMLQRQRQASVISLPTTTWYQLSLLNKGQAGEMSQERADGLRERAEMFYASSANATGSHQEEEDADQGFESLHITSADAEVVLGSSYGYAQQAEAFYEEQDLRSASFSSTVQAVELLHREDQSLLWAFVAWALNSGVDAPLIAESLAGLCIEDGTLSKEKNKHQQIRSRLQGLHTYQT
jgi:hypothetical protein